MDTTRATMGVLALFGIAGCKGDSGPDVTPPAVVSVMPADLAVEVPVTTTVVIQFSEALQASSVSDTAVSLSKGANRVVGTVALGGDGRTVTLTPARTLGNLVAYRVAIGTGIKDVAGNALAFQFVSFFTTAGASATVPDPTGDTYGSLSTIPDVTSLTATQDATGVTISMTFTGTVTASTSGQANALAGYIDLDTDQNPATGAGSLTDGFGPPGHAPSGISLEYLVVLFLDSSGAALVVDQNGNIVGSVMPTFSGSTVTLRIPLGMLGGDDGTLNLAAVLGTRSEPTDIVPNSGHVTLGSPGAAAASRVATRYGRSTVSRGTTWNSFSPSRIMP